MPHTFTFPWVLGNSKLQKTEKELGTRIAGFGIPADSATPGGGNTCPGALSCRAVCYAKQGAYTFRSVVEARKRALALTLRSDFTESLAEDLFHLQRMGVGLVRIHDSGDFYSQSYLDGWKEALTATGMAAYAYTKSLHLDLWTGLPKGFQLVQSLHGKFDARARLSRPHSRIFATHDAREAAGYVDGSETDIPAIQGVTRIGLVYHGTRHLTPAQERFFS